MIKFQATVTFLFQYFVIIYGCFHLTHISKKTKPKSSKAPNKVTKGDFHRAYQNVKKFDRLVARGKSPREMVNDMLRMIETDHDHS